MGSANRPKKLIKPPRLKPGDLVGMITPASNVPPEMAEESYAKLARNMEALGLRYRLGGGVRKYPGYIAGPEEARLADLHDMFADPEVKAVFCVRGGFGSPHLLDRINYDLIRRHPKIFLGYSDITAMHLAMHQRTGLVTLHGPAWNRELTPFTLGHLKHVLFDGGPIGKLPVAAEHEVKALVPGTARGRLVGGNLTLIAALMGTPYELDTRGAILLIEDVGEDPYRIDRMLTQLRLAGKFDGVAGIVWGACHQCVSKTNPRYELDDVYARVFAKLRVPVLSGLRFGHTDDQFTWAYGVRAALDAGRGELTIEEDAFKMVA